MNINNFKEMCILPNNDKTYNISVKTDMFDFNINKIIPVVIKYSRVKLNLDFQILHDLEDDKTLWTIELDE